MRNLVQLMLEKYPILRVKNILLFTFCILLNLSEIGHMTENKVIPEKQMQNLLICLCNKAVGIHTFCLCYFMWYVRSPHYSPAWAPSSRNLKPSSYQWKNFIKHSEFDLSHSLQTRLKYTQKSRLPSKINKFIATK